MSEIHGSVEKQDKVMVNKSSLLWYISTFCKGKSRAITSYELAQRLGIKVTNTNQAIRKACKELLEAGEPIVSCSKGFFYAENDMEMTEYKNNLQARMNGLLRDISFVDKLLAKEDARLF